MRRAPSHDEFLTLDEYLSTPETTKRRELVYGVVREPAAPTWGHQSLLGRLFVRLDQHVTQAGIGAAGLSPLDVILDAPRHLVLQPDLIVVMMARMDIIKDRVWGAPDLVVEVLSPGTRAYDRGDKREWYRQYGVLEAWFVDPIAREIEVHDLQAGRSTAFGVDENVRSTVLPELDLRVSSLFDESASNDD